MPSADQLASPLPPSPRGRGARALPTSSVVFTLVAIAMSAGTSARAGSDAGDYIPTPAPGFEGIGLVEHVGAHVPLDTPFRDQDGHEVTLRDAFRDDLPVLLTFNYSNCPMLCSQQLYALASAIATLDLAPGHEFRMVTIDLDSHENAQRAAETRAKYLDRLPAERRAAAQRGWTFLVARNSGDDAAIHAVADAVGFGYRYIPERNEYAHPAVLVFLSSRGVVTRYVGGIEYPADTLHDSIVRAGLAEASTSVGFVLTCFHYEATGRAHAAVRTMQLAAALFLGACLGVVAIWRRSSRKRRPDHG